MRSNGLIFLFLALGMIILLFLSVPVLKMIFGIDSKIFIETIKDSSIIDSVILTIKVSLWSTVFVLITGLPLAYILARFEFPFKTLIDAIIDIPIMIPHTAAGIALLSLFGENTEVGKFFKLLGIDFVGGDFGIMIAMMFLSAPYLITNARDGFKKVDVKLENVARTLGESPLKVFFKITLPLARRDVTNGAILMWARGLGEFGAVIILVYNPMVMPVLIYERFNSYGLAYSAPAAVLMVIVAVFIFIILRFLNNKKTFGT